MATPDLTSEPRATEGTPGDASPAADPPNRRQHQRIATSDPVGFLTLDPPSEQRRVVRLMDVSKTGLRLLSPVRVELGSLIRVDMTETSILARVRHCSPAKEPDQEGFQIGAEIQHVF